MVEYFQQLQFIAWCYMYCMFTNMYCLLTLNELPKFASSKLEAMSIVLISNDILADGLHSPDMPPKRTH